MLLKNPIFLIFLLSLTITIKGDFNVCPRFCKCDLYLQLNRAQCSSKRLISAEVEAPKVVQILDLSYNEITSIDNNSFRKYYHLKYLNLSHNAIQNLDLDSFTHLKRIVDIDLSNNRLEYLDERLFERNLQLEKLNLGGNKFMSIALKPLLKSSTLIELNLKNSQLNFIHDSIFAELSNLRVLDLSQNLLNTLRVEDFKNLKNLKTLQLSANAFKCDQEIKQKLQQLKSRGVNVVLDQCQANLEPISPMPGGVAVEKFQKMTMLDHLEIPEANVFEQWHFQLDSEEDLEDLDEDDDAGDIFEPNDPPLVTSEWLRFAPDAVLCDASKHKLCQGYRKCLVNLNTAWQEKHSMDSFVSSESKFAFFLGAACGITCVICILICALCVKNCFEAKKRDHIIEVSEPESTDLTGQPLARQQLPPQIRRQPRRRNGPPPHQRVAVVRYEGPVAENFLSRLFGRPARSQYYRTINQNTATLIRRLSRSNLFNNRLSQNYTDRQNSAENPSPEPQEFSPSAPRPETPPPCYGDVVINECEEGRK